MKKPILIALFCAFMSPCLAGAHDPSPDVILAMKNGSGLDYGGEIHGEAADGIDTWVFFDKEKFPVFMPSHSDALEMVDLAWSQRMLIQWQKANGFLK